MSSRVSFGATGRANYLGLAADEGDLNDGDD
jgi:hypothetical protein